MRGLSANKPKLTKTETIESFSQFGNKLKPLPSFESSPGHPSFNRRYTANVKSVKDNNLSLTIGSLQRQISHSPDAEFIDNRRYSLGNRAIGMMKSVEDVADESTISPRASKSSISSQDAKKDIEIDLPKHVPINVSHPSENETITFNTCIKKYNFN